MEIDGSNWAALSDLLDDALDLDAAAREEWLRSLAGEHAGLAEPLRALLAQRAVVETDDFLKLPEFVADLLGGAAQRTSPPEFAAGMALGAYRLLRELGQGGMGHVWLAERIDGRFQRQVALKFPYAGIHRRQLAQRLSRERDILARLEHPNIARLYDADVTALDQPFLVLEYVDGSPIGEYCDRQRLDVRARVELFLQVLSATRYAHAHLVIHRDLKPSNILITADGTARLLDFGIAKLTSEGEARETALTQLSGRALTPDYASPEQIAGQPITTASDVYSLGVVLYELLAGSRPYRLRRDTRASLEEAIAEADVIAPSRARLSAETAELRAATPRKLARALRGDLDAIILKTLRKDLAGRFATVDALGQDLRHWLDGEVVAAQPPGFWYRAGKLVRRNRLAVAAASGLLLLLLASTAVTLWQARAVMAQAERLKATKAFLVDVFNANSKAQDDPLKAQQTSARELLDRAAVRLETETHLSADETEEMLATLGGLYFGLGLDDKSAALQLRRVAVLKQMYGEQDPRVADALVSYGRSVYATDDFKKALPALQEAERILDAHHDDASYVRGQQLAGMSESLRSVDPVKARDYAQRGIAHERQFAPGSGQLIEDLRMEALIDSQAGNFPNAMQLLQEAMTLQERSGDPDTNFIRPMVELAEMQFALQSNAPAEANFRRALEITLRINGEDHVDSIQTRLRLGKFLRGMGRLRESEAVLRAAESSAVRLLGENETFHLPTVRDDLAQTEYALGEYAVAADLSRRALAARETTRSGNRQHAHMLTTQARLLIAMGHAAESERLMTRALEGYALAQVDAGSSDAPVVLSAMYLSQGRADDALAVLDRYPGAQRLTPMMQMDVSLQRAAVFVERGRNAEAEDLLHQQLQAVALQPHGDGWTLPTAQLQLQLGRALLARQAADDARGLLEASLAARAAALSPHSPVLADSQVALAQCLLVQGERARAQALFESAAIVQAFNAELADRYRQPFRHLQAALNERAAAPR